MEMDQLLQALTVYTRLPVDALRAADANRQAAVPVFLAEIERFLAADAAHRAADSPLFFVFHLLGTWRETSAYRLLARLLRCPRRDVDDVFGGAVTETTHRVMAAVFDGDPHPLYDIVLDTEADEFIRSRMCETIAMVALRGALPREEAARFLRRCFDELKPETDCFVWNGWQSAIAMLGLVELTGLVQQAFARGSIDESWLSFAHFEEDLEYASAHDGAMPLSVASEYDLFGDTVEELSWWYCFSDEYRREERRSRRAAADRGLSNPTAVSPFPKTGRNDPCPCGSGKKFKKCCLYAAPQPLAEQPSAAP